MDVKWSRARPLVFAAVVRNGGGVGKNTAIYREKTRVGENEQDPPDGQMADAFVCADDKYKDTPEAKE